MHHRDLNVVGQGSRNPVGVHLVRMQPLGLQENMVPVFVCKTVHLVFDTGTVASTDAFDLACEHRGTIKARTDDVVGFLIGIGDVAIDLRQHRFIVVERKATRWVVALLNLAGLPVDGTSIQTRRGAGFETPHIQIEREQLFSKPNGGTISSTSSLEVLESNVAQAAQEGAGGQHDFARAIGGAQVVDDAANRRTWIAFIEQQALDGSLLDIQALDIKQEFLCFFAIDLHVALLAQRTYRGSLAHVEAFVVDGGSIRQSPHDPTESINLTYEVTFGHAADRWITAHVSDRIDVHGQQKRPAAEHRSGVSCLRSCMSTTNNNQIPFFWVMVHRDYLIVYVKGGTSCKICDTVKSTCIKRHDFSRLRAVPLQANSGR